jgi:hypothetical protein
LRGGVVNQPRGWNLTRLSSRFFPFANQTPNAKAICE